MFTLLFRVLSRTLLNLGISTILTCSKCHLPLGSLKLVEGPQRVEVLTPTLNLGVEDWLEGRGDFPVPTEFLVHLPHKEPEPNPSSPPMFSVVGEPTSYLREFDPLGDTTVGSDGPETEGGRETEVVVVP